MLHTIGFIPDMVGIICILTQEHTILRIALLIYMDILRQMEIMATQHFGQEQMVPLETHIQLIQILKTGYLTKLNKIVNIFQIKRMPINRALLLTKWDIALD